MKASPHLSWRRTTMGGVYAVGGFIALIGVFMLLRALGIGPAGSLLAAGRLSKRDGCSSSDFRVKGADSSLGAVVSEAVRTQLGQSGVVSVLNPADGRRGAATHAAAADEPARSRAGARSRASAKGPRPSSTATSLRSAPGSSSRCVSSRSTRKPSWPRFTRRPNGASDLLPTLDKLVRSLRGKMGESLKQVHADPPLEQVTTASLEALRRYAEARRANNVEGDFAQGVELLEEAVALDTTFAMAYRSLGIAVHQP